jgi:hypothetical protein
MNGLGASGLLPRFQGWATLGSCDYADPDATPDRCPCPPHPPHPTPNQGVIGSREMDARMTIELDESKGITCAGGFEATVTNAFQEFKIDFTPPCRVRCARRPAGARAIGVPQARPLALQAVVGVIKQRRLFVQGSARPLGAVLSQECFSPCFAAPRPGRNPETPHPH